MAGSNRLSKKESQDLAVLNAMGTHSTIIPDYFERERRENMVEQGLCVEVEENAGWSADLKAEYKRLKEMERLEGKRTNRKDRLDDWGEETYDGGDLDETGDPEQDAWLRGDWWVRDKIVDL